jgi:protein phosphatase
LKSIRDIADLRANDVLYHSAFGFAVVQRVEPRGAELKWERDTPDLPVRVGAEVIRRAYARCSPDGFFASALRQPERLRAALADDPTDALALLLDDLPGPQAAHDLRDWVVGRGLMSGPAFDAWWRRTEGLCRSDPRFETSKGRVGLRGRQVALHTPVPAGLTRHTPQLGAGRPASFASAPAETTPDVASVVATAINADTSSPGHADAVATVRDLGPDLVLPIVCRREDAATAVPRLIDALGWTPDQLSLLVHGQLLEVALRPAATGSVPSAGALLAWLITWRAPDPASSVASALVARPTPTLAVLGAALDALELKHADRLLVAVLLLVDPPDVAELVLTVVAETARRGPSPAARQRWFASELSRRGRPDLALRLDATASPPPTRQDPRPTVAAPPTPVIASTLTEFDLRAAIRHDASALSVLGAAIASALVAPSPGSADAPLASRVRLIDWGMPSFRVDITGPLTAPADTGRAADVYAGAMLLVDALLGKAWSSAGASAERALPYLRTACPTLAPSSLAPLAAALHPDASARPAPTTWARSWALSLEAEHARGRAEHRQSVRMRVGYDSHIGKVKILQGQTNQDAVWVSSRGSRSMFTVCDGISTATAGSGDLAAGITCHVLATLWDQAISRLADATPEDVRRFVEKALDAANRAVCEATLRLAGGSMDGKVPMGTTAVVACVLGNRAHIAWVGDSRAYLVGPYGASMLTCDQNQAARRLTSWMSGERPHWDPAGYALVGYVGHFDDDMTPKALTPSHTALTLLPGERLVLCTDGVTDFIGGTPPEVDAALANVILESEDLEEAARAAVNLANRGGGGDNATVVVAALGD